MTGGEQEARSPLDIQWSDRAKEDLAAIGGYIAKDNFFLAGFQHGDGGVINYDLAPAWPPVSTFRDFATAMYFSAVTMSTLGYGDYAPLAGFSMVLSGVEAVTGVVLMAMFLVAMQRRYVGR